MNLLNEDKVESYRNTILDHARKPRLNQPIPSHSHSGHCTNPKCGDSVDVDLNVVNGRINGVSARAKGCSISVASASMMGQLVKEKTAQEALNLYDSLNVSIFQNPQETWPESIDALRPLEALRENKWRIPCALIPWMALNKALRD